MYIHILRSARSQGASLFSPGFRLRCGWIILAVRYFYRGRIALGSLPHRSSSNANRSFGQGVCIRLPLYNDGSGLILDALDRAQPAWYKLRIWKLQKEHHLPAINAGLFTTTHVWYFLCRTMTRYRFSESIEDKAGLLMYMRLPEGLSLTDSLWVSAASSTVLSWVLRRQWVCWQMATNIQHTWHHQGAKHRFQDWQPQLFWRVLREQHQMRQRGCRREKETELKQNVSGC